MSNYAHVQVLVKTTSPYHFTLVTSCSTEHTISAGIMCMYHFAGKWTVAFFLFFCHSFNNAAELLAFECTRE